VRKNSTKTLAHLITAMGRKSAVTIRYVKENGEVSRRGIEVHSIEVTKAGNIVVKAWDRRDAEMTTFRLDRITHYTLHRTTSEIARYAVPVAAADIAAQMDDDEVTGYTAWVIFELTA